jgi:hypothetical protein
MSFIVSGLDPQPFANLFSLDDEALARKNAQRVVVDAEVGFPCRVTLDDAPVGSTMLLLNYEHQPAPTPYRASHAIFVSESSARTQLRDQIPPALSRRMLSLRAFDRNGNMTDATIVQGAESKPEIERMLSDTGNEYIHAHYAARGCFAATITRAS